MPFIIYWLSARALMVMVIGFLVSESVFVLVLFVSVGKFLMNMVLFSKKQRMFVWGWVGGFGEQPNKYGLFLLVLLSLRVMGVPVNCRVMRVK